MDPFALCKKIVAFAALAAAVAAPLPCNADTEDPAMTALAKSLLAQAQSGKIDRTLFDATMNDALTTDRLAPITQQLSALGAPVSVTFSKHYTAGGYSAYEYAIAWPSVSFTEQFAFDASNKIAGWYFKPVSSTTSTTEEPAITALATSLLAQAQGGHPDRTLFTEKMNAGLTPEIVDSVAQKIGGLGKPAKISFLKRDTLGEYLAYDYLITWPSVSLRERIALDSTGKIAGWFFLPT